MSHLLTSTSLIKDIDCLRAAAKTFGAELVKSKKFHSYNGTNNPCEYYIKLPNTTYQVGVVKSGDGYALQHDPYGGINRNDHDGPKLVKAFGKGLSLLTNAYNEQTIIKTAKQHGFTITRRVLPNGDIALKAVRMAGAKAYNYQKVGAK